MNVYIVIESLNGDLMIKRVFKNLEKAKRYASDEAKRTDKKHTIVVRKVES